ncbi:MAG TPA: YciI family protein [Pyrinomonadaceae bacterium]|nr:YciI family protein [Pyrinomonadaceae bacterium]
MKYMLLIYHEEQNWNSHTEPERQEIYREYRELIQGLQSDGKYQMGDQLQPTSTARTVRVRNGKHLVTDGPFAETREQLGGFFLIEAKDLDEAQSVAARIPSARTGSIEIRPVVEAAAPASA